MGVLLLVQMASALIFPFVLIGALQKGYPGFLETAAPGGTQIRFGVALGYVGAALTLTLGIRMFSVLRPYSFAAASAFLAVCLISSTLDAVHSASVLNMLSAGEQYFAASAGDNIDLFRAWGAMAAGMRRSAHIVQLIGIAGWMATFYVSLWRYRLVPRPLSALGILGVASQFTGVTLMMFLGYPVLGYLAMPLAPIHAATAVWLIVRGFSIVPGAVDEG